MVWNVSSVGLELWPYKPCVIGSSPIRSICGGDLSVPQLFKGLEESKSFSMQFYLKIS